MRVRTWRSEHVPAVLSSCSDLTSLGQGLQMGGGCVGTCMITQYNITPPFQNGAKNVRFFSSTDTFMSLVQNASHIMIPSLSFVKMVPKHDLSCFLHQARSGAVFKTRLESMIQKFNPIFFIFSLPDVCTSKRNTTTGTVLCLISRSRKNRLAVQHRRAGIAYVPRVNALV